MSSYVLRRLLALVPTLFFASVIVFVTVRLIPGDIIDLMLSERDISSAELSRDQLLHALGLDRPLWEQYLRWVGGILFHADLGKSLWQGVPVTEQLAERLPVSFELGLIAMVIGLTIALPVGVYSAIRQDTATDYVTRSISILMLSIPAFWVGTIVTVFPSIWWGWSPAVEYTRFSDDPLLNLKQMLLPAAVLGMALSAVTMRMTRTMMLEVLRQDYIRTARAKGLPEGTVIYKHALRNALMPVITILGLSLPGIIGGSVIMETVFGIDGMGRLMYQAVFSRDYNVAMGVLVPAAALTMLGNFLADICYALADPRVRLK